MGGTLSSEQQAHDQLVNAADKQGAFSGFLKQIADKPNFLSTLHLKTNSKTVSTILNYLSTCLEQKNYPNIVPVLQVIQRLLRFESFYRDVSRTSNLEPIIKTLELTNQDECVEEALTSLELMVRCQVFNRGQAGFCAGSSGESNIGSTPGEQLKNSNNDPKIHALESNMKILLTNNQNRLPLALSKLFTHYIASVPNHQLTKPQHHIIQTILRLIRHFLKTTIRTSLYPQVLNILDEFRIHNDNVINLTINTNPFTRQEATETLLQLIIHSNQNVTRSIQESCLNRGYILWYVYIALNKKNVHNNVHKSWDQQEHHKLYAYLIGFLCDGNDIISRLLFRMIPKCLHDNAKVRQQTLKLPNFNQQLYLSTSTPQQRKDFDISTHGLYLQEIRKHGDWVSVFEEIDLDHELPLIVWNQQDKAELIEILLNESVDYNLQLELSPSSLWDYDGFEVDYSSQSKYLIVNRYYLHLLLPHYESSEPQAAEINNNGGDDNIIDDEGNNQQQEQQQQHRPRHIKQIGNRPTTLSNVQGLLVPTRGSTTDPYAISLIDLANFMSACFQRAVVEDDVGWKLACLRMMRTLYVHNTRVLQETNFMPYLLWLLTPKTTTGTLFDVNETTNIVFTQDDSDESSPDDDITIGSSSSGIAAVATAGTAGTTGTTTPITAPGQFPTSSSGLSKRSHSRNSLLSPPLKETQSTHDPNATITKFESKIEREIAFSLTSSFNNPRWRDQILKFLDILFDYAGNINKFVAGNGINTLLYFINNVHRENHSQSLQEIDELLSELSPQDRQHFSEIPGINMQALLNPTTFHSKHHNITATHHGGVSTANTAVGVGVGVGTGARPSSGSPPPPPPPPQFHRIDSQPQGFRRSSIPTVPTIEELNETAKKGLAAAPPVIGGSGSGLKVNVDPDQSCDAPTVGSGSNPVTPRTRLIRNASDFHAHSPLASSNYNNNNNDSENDNQPFSSLAKSPSTIISSQYDSDHSPVLALLDPLWHKAVTFNQQFRDLNPLKKVDLLTNTIQPDGITEVARKSLNLLLKIVTNAPRLRKKIFKPRVLTSLVQLILIDNRDMVNVALQVLTILVDANTHIIPNLAKSGVFLFLLYAGRRYNQFSPEMIKFIEKYHTKQNVSFITRGQSIYNYLFPEPLINLSLQPQGGEYFCNIVNNASTISHRILWDSSHKEIMSRIIMLHLAPFVQKLVLCPFSTYTFPFDGKNSHCFKIEPLRIKYPSINNELFVGNVYVRLFNLETNRLNLSILSTSKAQKISISHGPTFLLSLLRQLSQNHKYYTTRTLTLLEHFQLLSCVQPKPIVQNKNDKNKVSSSSSSSPSICDDSNLDKDSREHIIFLNEVEFTTPIFPMVKQQQPYQTLFEHQQKMQQISSNSPLSPPIIRPGSSGGTTTGPTQLTITTFDQYHNNNNNNNNNGGSFSLYDASTSYDPFNGGADSKKELSAKEIILIKEHLLEALQAIAVLAAQFPQEDDIFHFKQPLHLIALLASVEAPYDATNRGLVIISQILRALLVIPSSTNAQVLVNHGILRVVMRVLVVIGQNIMATKTPSKNVFDHTQDPFHNDNIDLFIQYLHIFTALLLQGRSSHRPGPFYFQLTMTLYDTAACKDFFLILQTVLGTNSLHYSERQYLLASTFRFLQAISMYDQAVLNSQLDNVLFLKDRLTYNFDIAIEATTYHHENGTKTPVIAPSGGKSPSHFKDPDAVNRFSAPSHDSSAPKITLQQALSSIPTIHDFNGSGLYTPNRYIAQYGLILDTIRAALACDDDKELTVYSIGGVVSASTALPAFLGKTPTRNSHARPLLQAYPSNKTVFNAGLYLEEITFDEHDGHADANALKSSTSSAGAASGRQLVRTVRSRGGPNAGGRATQGPTINKNPGAAGSNTDLLNDRDVVDYQNEERKAGGAQQRGSLLSGADQHRLASVAAPQLQDLLYSSPLAKSHRDLLGQQQSSPKNSETKQEVFVLGQKYATHAQAAATNAAMASPDLAPRKTINDDMTITTLEDAITLQQSQLPFIPCTPTFLQHEKSLPIRKEAITFFTILLSTTLPTLLSHPSTYSSNTCLHELSGELHPSVASSSALSGTVAIAAPSPVANITTTSGAASPSVMKKDNIFSQCDSSSSSSAATDFDILQRMLTYRWKSIEISHLNIAQQLLTPGALFVLAKLVAHTRYFLQQTPEYFSNISMLTMISAHCHVPVEYKSFIEVIDLSSTNGGEFVSPTYIWSAKLRNECLSMIATSTKRFHLAHAPSNAVATTFNTSFGLQSTNYQLPAKAFVGYSTAGQWQWANDLFTYRPTVSLSSLPLTTAAGNYLTAEQLAVLQHNILTFPITISILTNEIIIEGVYTRIWFQQSQQVKDKTSLLPKPLSSTHLFNHICLVLYRYALLAPHRLSNAPGAAGIIANTANVTTEGNPNNPSLNISGPDLEDLDITLTLDLGYIKKDYDLEKLHHSTILVDNAFAIDFTTPMMKKIYDFSWLPAYDDLLSEKYVACTHQSTKHESLSIFHRNVQLLAACLQELAGQPDCDVKALSAPLNVKPDAMITGRKHSQQFYPYYGVYKLLSLLACERTPAASTNVVCTVLYIMQKDLVESTQLGPDFATKFDLKDKKTSDMFKFSQAFDIISNCSQYLISLLVRPYQALPPDTAPVSMAPAAPTSRAPTAPGRRDSAFASNPFVTQNHATPAPTGHRNSLIGHSPAPVRTLNSVHQRSEQRVHLLLLLQVLYNLILSQTLLRRGKVLETLYKTGVVATLLGILLRPAAHPQAIEPSELNWVLSSHVTMKSLFSTSNQNVTGLIENTPGVSPTSRLGNFDLSSNTDIANIDYFPFTTDIDATPSPHDTPLALPFTIPDQYTFDKQQRQDTAGLCPAGVSKTIPPIAVGRTTTAPSSGRSFSEFVTNHPLNCSHNTYTTAHRLLATKILGLLFIHPIASPYFRAATAAILSPQFYTTIAKAQQNPLPFISQLYTECISPAFVWNSISRGEATKFIHHEVQNLYYYHLQQNRYFAQYLYLQEKRADCIRQRDSRLLEERKMSTPEEQIETIVEQLTSAAYKSTQNVLSDHYVSLYQRHIVDYQHHVAFVPPAATEAPGAAAPAKVSSFRPATTTPTPATTTPTVTNQGLPYLSTEDIANCTQSDPLDQYYGVFSYEHTPILFQTELDGDGDDDGENFTQAFPTTQFQGTLTQQDVGATTWSSRFPRLYLTHQVHIPINNDTGSGMYLNPLIMLHKQGTSAENKPLRNQLLFKIDTPKKFFDNLVNATIEQMGRVTTLKQYIRDAENLHQEAIEDGYLDPETGQLRNQTTVANLRREQLIEIHRQERERRRQMIEQQRKQIELQHSQQQAQNKASRRTSTLLVSNTNTASHASRSPTTPRGEVGGNERDRSDRSASAVPSGKAGEERSGHHDKPIPEDDDDDDDDENNGSLCIQSLSNSTDQQDPMDDPVYVAKLWTNDWLYQQVASTVVSKTDLFHMYYDIPLATALLCKMLDTITYILSIPQVEYKLREVDISAGGVEKSIGTEDKVSKLAEFILLESDSDALTFKVDEQLFFQSLSWTDPNEALEQGAPGPNPQDFYPPLPVNNPLTGVLRSINLAPMYDLDSSTNPLVFKTVLVLQSLIASPSVPAQSQTLLAMHKAKISRWLLPVLFLAFDRYEFVVDDKIVPAVKPTILYPVVYILYTLMSSHPEHIDDLVNMGALFYYLSLALQKQHIPDHLWKTVLYSICKIAQRSQRTRLETMNFLVCEFTESIVNIQTQKVVLPPVLRHNSDDANIDQTIKISATDEHWNTLVEFLYNYTDPCPLCDRHWGPTHIQNLITLFKDFLPQNTLRAITYTPERGRIYNITEVLGSIGYDDYSPDLKAYIAEFYVVALPTGHLNEEIPKDDPSPPPAPLVSPTSGDRNINSEEDSPAPLAPPSRSSLPPPPEGTTALEFSDSEVSQTMLKGKPLGGLPQAGATTAG